MRKSASVIYAVRHRVSGRQGHPLELVLDSLVLDRRLVGGASQTFRRAARSGGTTAQRSTMRSPDPMLNHVSSEDEEDSKDLSTMRNKQQQQQQPPKSASSSNQQPAAASSSSSSQAASSQKFEQCQMPVKADLSLALVLDSLVLFDEKVTQCDL